MDGIEICVSTVNHSHIYLFGQVFFCFPTSPKPSSLQREKSTMSRLVLVVGLLFLWGGAFANFVDRMEQRVKDVVDRDVKPALGLGDQNPATLFCATGSSPAIAITFSSEAECAAYQAAQVQGATVGTTFSNCSVSTWCSTFTAGISGSTKGFTVVGVSVYSANNGDRKSVV
jgi:hypothetical protein